MQDGYDQALADHSDGFDVFSWEPHPHRLWLCRWCRGYRSAVEDLLGDTRALGGR